MAGPQQQPIVVVVPPQPQSHNYWGTLSGAASGAAVGTVVFPVVGTAIGSVVGGFLGYIMRDAPLAASGAQQPQVSIQQPQQPPL